MDAGDDIEIGRRQRGETKEGERKKAGGDADWKEAEERGERRKEKGRRQGVT